MKSCLFFLFLCASACVLAQSNPVPLIDLPLVPASAAPGGPGFTLTVNGAGFVSGAMVSWSGHALTTQFVSETQLKATILAVDISTAATVSVSVANPGSPNVASNVAFFSITAPLTTVAFTGSNFTTLGNPEYIAVGDFNRDGKLDVAVANWTLNNSVGILLGRGDGSFKPVSLFPAGEQVGGIVVGDFNGDGKLDLATSDYRSNAISILLGNGDGSFRPPISYLASENQIGIVTGDFNRDGTLDLAVASYDNVAIFLGNGDGTFRAGSKMRFSAFDICTGDFNGDGILDLAAVDYYATGVVGVFLGKGDGTFQPEVDYLTGSFPSTIRTADLNGDGILDLVTGDNDGAAVLMGRGDGSFGKQTTYPTSYSMANAATIADLNGDGILDIAVGNESANTISILLGNGDGTFQQTANDFQSGLQVYSLIAGDFNNDGAMDLALGSYGTSDLGGGAYVALQTNGPAVLFSQAELNFPTQLMGTSSAISVLMTNVGKERLDISQIGTSGGQAQDFSLRNDCGGSVTVGSSCHIDVTFTPKNKGPRAATLVVQDNAINQQQSIPLSGTGTWMTLSPSSLNFGTQQVGTISPVKFATLTNIGTGPVTVSDIFLKNTSDIQFITHPNGCGTLSPGASCTIGVQFAPTRAREYPNVLETQDSGGGGVQQTTLYGTGVN